MGKTIYGLSRAMTWFGAFTLAVLATVTVFSIVGRSLSFAGLGPVPGDFELVEVGTALAVFCFLPWAHLSRGHATVDLFWKAFPTSVRYGLEVAADALMLFVWVLLVWRMGVATLDYRGNAETTFILQFPVWWGYAVSMIPAVIGCIAYLWRLFESLGLVAAPAGFTLSGAQH
jgi:TRAP-type C4-dicarboxylate transport system permease small subunit